MYTEADMLEVVDERERLEEQITTIAAALGITEEWSSENDLGELALDAARERPPPALSEPREEALRDEQTHVMSALRCLRGNRGWTQEELGSRSDLDAMTISHYETGRRSPSVANLVKLADALDVTVDRVLGRTPDQRALGKIKANLQARLCVCEEGYDEANRGFTCQRCEHIDAIEIVEEMLAALVPQGEKP